MSSSEVSFACVKYERNVLLLAISHLRVLQLAHTALASLYLQLQSFLYVPKIPVFRVDLVKTVASARTRAGRKNVFCS